MYKIEIATSDYQTTANAVAGGADRIELCANLAEGGTTASFGTIQKCREQFAVQLYPIIRPRGGDFLYNDEEFDIMIRDVKMCKEIGCDGIVLGMLDVNGDIEIKRISKLAEIAYPMKATFHRAFDRCRDAVVALEQVIAAGCERILTSGLQRHAMDSADVIASLNKMADNRIVIMPGSGVRGENIAELAQKTGCKEFHASLRERRKSEMQYINPAFAEDSESYFNNFIDTEAVRALRNALNSIC